MTENDTCDTFKSRNDSTITLLFAKENWKWLNKYTKTFTVLLHNGGGIISKERGFKQRYTDYRQQNSWIELKRMNTETKTEEQCLVWSVHTCNTVNLKCSAPTTLGKCAEFQIHRTEPALGQRRDFAWVLGHSLQFSSGILAEQMVISKQTIRGRSKEVTKSYHKGN